MELTVEINIPASRSPAYRQIISTAKSTGCFNPDTNLFSIVGIMEVFRLWEPFSFIVWQCQKWSGFYVRLNGKLVLPYSNYWYYALQTVKYCWHSQSKDEYIGYCTNRSFGCRQLRSVSRPVEPGLRDSQIWYRYGYFEDGLKYWHIDKPAILKQLLNEANLALPAYCPAFMPENIANMVSLLPDRILIDEFWEIEYDVMIRERGIENVPVNVRCRLDLYNVDSIQPGRMSVAAGSKPGSDWTVEEINRYLDNLLKQKKQE